MLQQAVSRRETAGLSAPGVLELVKRCGDCIALAFCGQLGSKATHQSCSKCRQSPFSSVDMTLRKGHLDYGVLIQIGATYIVSQQGNQVKRPVTLSLRMV